MDYEENMAAEQATEAATADDMLSDEIVEEAEEPAESLDSLMGEEEEQPSVEEQEPAQKANEPGYVQKRIDKALAKQKETMREEILNEVKSQLEAEYAPIRERLLEMDAQELVRKGEVKNIELAKELLRYRQGNPAPQAQPTEKAERPRQADGKFAPKEDPSIATRVDMLDHQQKTIKEKMGIDVMEVFNTDKSIRDKVTSGKMDFYDVAEMIKSNPQGKRRPPAPTRSSNGASGQSPNAIENMTDEQFARMERKIAEGARFALR